MMDPVRSFCIYNQSYQLAFSLQIKIAPIFLCFIMTQVQLQQPIQIYHIIVGQIHNKAMGNSNSNKSLTLDVLSDFKELKKDSQGIMLEHITTHQTYLLKQYTYASDTIYHREVSRLEKQCSQRICDNILSVFKVKTHTIEGLCSTTHKVYAIYEYPQVNLQDQIMARKKQNKRFEQNQLWSIIQSCNTALMHLKSTISLNTQLIFITQEGELKVIHNDMIDQNYRYVINQSYYYAPQKIMNFTKMDSELSLIKEAVFSMGLTVLQAALLEETLQCYDFDKNLFLDVVLEAMIDSLEESYSVDFTQIMTMILKIEPDHRPNFTEIQKLLDNYWSSLAEVEEAGDDKQHNGSSLNIRGEESNRKRFLMASHEEKGIIRNLATINSQQKESIRPQPEQFKKGLCINKISESIEPSRQQRISLSKNQLHETPAPKGHLSIKSTIKNNSNKSNKENLYTDPKLLAMIRKDLDDINKLKQSTLKQTIKYSFLYPESDSIFKSIQDVKLSMKPLNQSINASQSRQQMEQSFPRIILNNQRKEKMLISNQDNQVYRKFTDEEGHFYEGYTLNGMKHGQGRLQFEDGAFYEGNFEKDQINGKGILYYCQGKPAYDGQWVNGQFHGTGILYNECPQELNSPFDYQDFDDMQEYWLRYTGEFNYDNKCGRGCLQLTNGEVLDAIFQDDMINGQGIFYSKEGEVRGVWQMNRLVHINQQ